MTVLLSRPRGDTATPLASAQARTAFASTSPASTSPPLAGAAAALLVPVRRARRPAPPPAGAPALRDAARYGATASANSSAWWELVPAAAAGGPPARGRAAAGLALLLLLAAGVVVLAGTAARSGLRGSAALLVLVVAASLLPAVVRRPRLVLTGLVVLTVSHGSAQLSALGVPRPYVLALLSGLAAAVLGVRAGRLRVPRGPVLTWTGALLAVQVLPAALADDGRLAVASLQDLAVGAVALVVVATLATSPGGARTLVTSAVATATGLAGLTLVHALLLPGRVDLLGLSIQQDAALGSAVPRYAGPVGDANFWGRDLVLFLLLALGCALADRGLARLAAGGASLLLGVAVLLTGSRGTFLATAVAVLVWLCATGPRTRRSLWLVPAVLVLLLALPGVGSRLASLNGPQTASGTDPSLDGRRNALAYGTSMFLDHPLLGVGPGNFIREVATYQRRAGDSTPPIAAHNLYVQQAAETGTPGLLVWLGFLATALATAYRALRGARARAPTGERRTALPAALLGALAGWAVAGLFLHLADFDALGLVVAAALVLTPAALSPAPPQPQPLVLRRRRRLVAVLVGLDVLLGALLVLPWRRSVAVGEFTVAVTTVDAAPTPYLLDVRNRPEVVGTFAQVLRSGTSDGPGADRRATRTVQVPTNSTVIVVVIRSRTRTATAGTTAAAFEGALQLGVRADAEYTLTAAGGPPRLRTVREVQPTVVGAAVALAGLAGAGAAQVLARRRSAGRLA